MQSPDEIKEYLAKIRKSIAESEALVEQASLRIQETDRFLAQQGLTREHVLNMSFTREQILAVNEELRRRGLPPVEDDEAAFSFDAATDELRRAASVQGGLEAEAGSSDELADRQRKFGTFMQQFRI